MNNNELRIDLDGQLRDRKEFLKNFMIAVTSFFSEKRDVNVMVMFLREMVKNIFDHANGVGKVTLVKSSRGICFVVEDFGIKSFDFEALKYKGSSKAGNNINYGVGLGLIEDMSYVLEVIDFKIDCSHGFKYSGIYPIKQPPT